MVNAVHTGDSAFTIIELMLVVVIVAILALAFLPSYVSSVDAGKMTEGMTGVGLIRSSLRMYCATHNDCYPVLNNVTAEDLDVVLIAPTDLNGKYFQASDYLINSNASSYTVRVTLPTDGNCWYEVDEDGNETKHVF